MKERTTDYGRLLIGEKEELFGEAMRVVADAKTTAAGSSFTWAFTGGSTPQAWYRWAAAGGALTPGLIAGIHFTVSDERCVPLTSEESNFGNAERLLLAPLAVPVEQRHPWVTSLTPVEAAAAYASTMAALQAPGRCYDVCFLGMGDDAHTASFFPGSELLNQDTADFYAAINTPQKGWRLTVTPAGLQACGLVVVMALGAGKAPALRRVMQGDDALAEAPAKILATCADRVVWLVDEAAAAALA